MTATGSTADMAQVDNAVDKATVVDLAQQFDDAWIGYFRPAGPSAFMWSDRTRGDFAEWAPPIISSRPVKRQHR
ncbi:MAG: hypothetical protein AAGF94_15875 [Pseudomonadota bacterium]